MPHNGHFATDLGFSKGRLERTDIETIRSMITGCVEIMKTGEALDRLHVDYVARLRRGGVLHIDAKTRRAGASRYWTSRSRGREFTPNGEPDLAIEYWSVCPFGRAARRRAWLDA